MKKKTFLHFCLSVFYLSLTSEPCYALPAVSKVVSGTLQSRQVNSQNLEMIPSDGAILEYFRFDIGEKEKVRFIQDSPSSCVLNRVKGSDPSQIFGSLESNGKVFLVNPNGIYFGPNSKVNMGSLIASTLDISNEDFLEKNYRFSLEKKDSRIVNEGSLSSIEGSIVLMAPQIRNSGVIQAKAGNVLLASGQQITLDFAGDGLIQFSVEGSLKESLIEHLGQIEGSSVFLKLPTAKKAIEDIVNIDGLEKGEVFVEENGIVKLVSASTIEANEILLQGANLKVEGNLTVASSSGDGGQIHLLGTDISLTGAHLDASGKSGGGKVLIGGEFQGKGQTPWASRVSMDKDSEIHASALEEGDGGLVVLWSLDHTQFNGKVVAQGGAVRGNGGLVESSGFYKLETETPDVDTMAFNGEIGNWLLDPKNLVIASGTGGGTGDCSSSPDVSYTKVEAFQGSSSNVTLQAYNNIYLEYDINMSKVGVGITFQSCSNYPNGFTVGTTAPSPYNHVTIRTKGGFINCPSGTAVAYSDVSFDTTGNGSYSGADITIPLLFGGLSSSQVRNLEIKAGAGTVYLNAGLPQGSEGAVLAGSVTINSASKVQSNSVFINGNFSATNSALLMGGSNPTVSASSIFLRSIDAYESSNQKILVAATGQVSISQNVGGLAVSGSYLPYGFELSSGTAGATFSNITTNGGPISIYGTLNSIGSNTAFRSNGGNIFFQGINSSSSTLTVDAGTGSITSSGSLSIDNFYATGGSNITFSTINAAGTAISLAIPGLVASSNVSLTTANGSILFGSTIDGVDATTCSLSLFPGAAGTISFSGNIGFTNTLGSLNIGSGTVSNWANIKTYGNITVTPPITLNKDITMSSDIGTIDLKNTVNALTSGGESLLLSALSVNLEAPVGGVNRLNDFTVRGSTLLCSNIQTVGSIDISSAVSLTADTLISSTSGNIAFESLINGPYNLTLSALNGDLGYSAIGGSSPPISVTISALDIVNFSDITTSGGDITINLDCNLNKNTVLTAISGDIYIQGNINATTSGSGAETLSFSAINGSITVLGQIGNVYPLGNLSVPSTGTEMVNLQGGIFTDSSSMGGGSIEIGASLMLGGSTVVNSRGTGAGANITFENVTGSSAYSLSCDAGAGSISLATISSPLTDVSLTGNNVNIFGISSISSLTINNSGSITFGVGGINVVGSLSQIGTGDVFLNSNITAGSVSFGSDLTLKQTPITITSTSGNLSFQQILNNLSGTVSLSLISAANVSVVNDLTIDTLNVLAATGIAMNGNLFVDVANLATTSGDIGLGQILAQGDLTITATGGGISTSNLNADDCTLNALGSIIISGDLNATNFVLVNSSQTTIVGMVASGLIDLQNTIGTILFEGSVVSDSFSTSSQGYKIVMENGGSIHSPVTFSNTGGVVLQANSSTQFLFDGSVISTASPTTISGVTACSSGSMDFSTLVFEPGTSSLTTVGFPIQFLGSVTLLGDATVTTTGGNVSFFYEIEGPGGLNLNVGSGIIDLERSIGQNTPLAYFNAMQQSLAYVKDVKCLGRIYLTSDINIMDSLTTFSSDAEIVLGDIDGTSIGGQGLEVIAGKASSLGAIGQNTPLANVYIQSEISSTIRNITTAGTISIQGPISLGSSTTLKTSSVNPLGFDITLDQIDGTTIGGQQLIVDSGVLGSVTFLSGIGAEIPIQSLEVTGRFGLIKSPGVHVLGSQSYYSPVIAGEKIVFTTSGDVTFYSSFDALLETPSVVFNMGGGNIEFLGSVGNSFMPDLAIFNSGSFSCHKITARSLRVKGGLPEITINDNIDLSGVIGLNLDGGPIYLGGEIDAPYVFMRSSGSVANLDEPTPINISSDNSLRALEYFNAMGGNLGSPSSPIELNTVRSANIGSNFRADFIGTPYHDYFFLVQNNPPCIVTFNGVTILDCQDFSSPQTQFVSVPNNLLYVPGIYSSWSWDNLSHNWYFQLPDPNPTIPNDTKIFYIPPKKSQRLKKKSL